MTIPTLITKYQTKALETGFKKSYSMLMQSIVPVQNEFYGSMTTGSSIRETDFYNALWQRYKVISSDVNGYDTWKKLNYQDNKGNFLLKDYAGNSINYPGCAQLPTQILADGSAVGGMYNCYSNWIVFDVNGSGGPNALGHDIFYFGLDNNTRKLIPLGEGAYSYWNYKDYSNFCSKNSTNAQNGVGCTYWALKNVCPDDQTKKYWECLP